MKPFAVIAALLIIFFSTLEGAKESGTTFIKNYNRKQYKSKAQNWGIVQGRSGFIYSANQGSLLEYDGVSWNEYLIPKKTVRSLAVDETGTVYSGGNNEIGCLKPHPSGVMRYHSLTHLLDPIHADFGFVWRTCHTTEGIYFCTSKYLFRFKTGRIKTWTAETRFSPPFLCDGKLIVRQQNVGLMVMQNGGRNGGLQKIPGGEAFANESVYTICPYKAETLLVGTGSKGFFLLKKGLLTPFETPALKSVAVNHLSYGTRLSDGNFALATRKGGIFIIDTQGRLKNRFNTSTGLAGNTVTYLCEDRAGNLWAALYNGIAVIEYQAPFSFFHKSHNLPALTLTTIRHGPDNRLYAGTGSGLSVMNNEKKFQPLPDIPGNCYALFSSGNSLLAATDKGIFHVGGKNSDGTRAPLKITSNPAYIFFSHPGQTWPLLAGTQKGLVALSQNPQTRRWSHQPYLQQINQEIRTIALGPRGSLWLGSPQKGIIKISGPIAPAIRRFDRSPFSPGGPTGKSAGDLHVFRAAGHIIIATGNGIYKWDEKKNTWVPDLTLGPRFAGGEKGLSVKLLVEDRNKNIWFHALARNLLAVPGPGNSTRIYRKKFLRIPFSTVSGIYPDPIEPAVWFAGADGLMRVDTTTDFEHHALFRSFIRDVSANGVSILGRDSLPELPFKQRSLRFTFAAPFYRAPEKIRYRCRLEGYDLDWTQWSAEPHKDYTNLEPGLNVFRVQAQNIYGDISQEASFRFKILPPWTRTWWAYSLYILSSLLLVGLLVKWRSAQLIRDKQRLEGEVDQRTREINQKNEQLQEMATIKSHFFANISHEFRTPLTLILGPLDQMMEETGDTGLHKKYKLMRRNAQRLLNLINQLLELSKLDSGQVTLNTSSRDIVSFLKGLTASFELLTTRKDQQLSFQVEIEKIMVYFDMTRMEEVFCNLLINAVKFTPAGGEITVSLKSTPANPEQPLFPHGWVEIEVNDTGPGIPKDRVAHIFQRFYYSPNTSEQEQKGAGIGLALAKEWVELHHGTISVNGQEGKGSRFTVRLPLGKEHLLPHEITCFPLAQGKQPGVIAQIMDEDIEQEVEQENGNAVIEPFDGDKELILVVEDSSDVLDYIRDALEPRYKVIEAQNGKTGIEKALSVIPDLIVSDVMMPEADGIELCRALKRDRNTSHIPIILLTAKASEDNMLEGLETGADDYISKPFSIRLLVARIKNLIHLRRLLQKDHPISGSTDNPVSTNNAKPGVKGISTLDREFFKDLHDVIESNLEDPDFNVEQLARRLIMSQTTVYRKIKALCGENPGDYIRSYRLQRAAQLLRSDKASVTEVAFEVGFSSRTYFTKCFKEKFNQLPSAFRKSN